MYYVSRPAVVVLKASATVDTSTTSQSDVLIDSMTITPEAGTYMVWFYSSGHNSQLNTIYFSIYQGGVVVADTVTAVKTSFNSGLLGLGVVILDSPISSCTVCTVDGTQAIEARWRVDGGTAVVHQRSLLVMRMQQ